MIFIRTRTKAFWAHPSSDWSTLIIGTNQDEPANSAIKVRNIFVLSCSRILFGLDNTVKMMQPQSKLKTTNKETREGNLMSIPTVQSQASDRIPTPPPSPEKRQHDLYWRETVLYWNEHNFRMTLIEYVPCLMGIIWEEDRMGRIESLNSFPMEAQYYFFKGFDAGSLNLTSTNYHRLFRTKIGSGSYRRMSEPEVNGSRHLDPHGIAQDSFLFGRFLKNVMKTTKVSCTSLILSLKFAQSFLKKIRAINMPYCAGLESNQFRLFVTCILLADKYSEDHPYTNKSWSSLSGLPVDDINTMERAFLSVMQHEMFVSESEFREWTKALQNLCQWEMPITHHSESGRRSSFSIFNQSKSTRRVSFTNFNEVVTIQDEELNSSSSSNSFNAESSEKPSFWSRFRFHRK